MKSYKPTIGIEVHAELKTNTKMFCNSKNNPHADTPNTHVCPICMAHPGTLPVINKKAVEHVIKVGLALGGEIASYTEFDRKNYFYPDIPKGYQISQYEYQIVKGGKLMGVDITRDHHEEDTARSLHGEGENSLVDYNRAGVPLMELVTEPVIHDAKTAANFARELQLLLRTLGASDAHMEKGEMRVEANISVSDTETFGTKVEVKNLNSFKAVEGAIEYEIKRHIEIIESGGTLIQETRGWDDIKGKTFSQRVKESANDYRYFPEPDLPKISLFTGDISISRLHDNLPELPDEKREKYSNLGLSRELVEVILSDILLDRFFSELLTIFGDSVSEHAKIASNYLVTDVLPLLMDRSISTASTSGFAQLIILVASNEITSRTAKDILEEVLFNALDPVLYIDTHGLRQKNSLDTVQSFAREVCAQNPGVVDEFRQGKEASLQFLIGQAMKLSKGSANPKLLAEAIKSTINDV